MQRKKQVRQINYGIEEEALATAEAVGAIEFIESNLHPQTAAADVEIWTRRLPQSGRALAHAPDFQIYPANFRVGDGGWLAYYIPIE